ncbi:permease [Pelagicoccus sp. SDUM812002]|uniref:permease n=1 Tax=Pelagicoccus sp. SDUM812002 TaxID=3041266 RepID=UPI00280CFE7C|nr:permease [Pelagicoccus sp. SDUM812002]MDQ8184131.1 permease [Pelagicoccus sp. SDUM812002]
MKQPFLDLWAESATTTAGLFWMAFWAFGFGYLISSMIQVFVTRERMQKSMDETGPKSIALGSFFGFISSSCSFAALSGARAIFTKGAGLIPALAFLLASTNLVIELGIVIAVFLSWQFVVGEYVGGILLILLMWIIVKASLPKGLEKSAREHARDEEGADEKEDTPDWRKLIRSKEGWLMVAKRYAMEWGMVWKDVTIGFTIAGIIAAFVPKAFFQTLFVGSGADSLSFWQVLVQTLVGPVAAFFTFIGSMGNIPLAAVLFGNGVSFAGVMAFVFSDLVVLPVLRIQAQYYGWKMAFYILGVFLAALVGSALLMHYGFALAGMLPDPSEAKSVTEREFFKVDYSLFLNIAFLALTAIFYFWKRSKSDGHGMSSGNLKEKILFWLACASFVWVLGGIAISSQS